MVVELRPEDLMNEELNSLICHSERSEESEHIHPLSMMYLQEALEAACWQQGNMRQTAPAQRMVDFTRKKLSYDLPASSYSPGLVSSPLHFWMPHFISDRLSKGFQQFGRSSHGFLTNEACMIGMETRTSAPVRIVRDNETCNTSPWVDSSLAEKEPDMRVASCRPVSMANDVPMPWPCI